MPDFSRKQAAQWVAQEFAKHKTPESIKARIATEESFLHSAFNAGFATTLPNSYGAHMDLVKALREVVS